MGLGPFNKIPCHTLQRENVACGAAVSATDSRRAAVFTGSWTEFMKLPDPVHAACEAADLDAVVSFLEGEGGEWLRTQGPRVYGPSRSFLARYPSFPMTCAGRVRTASSL